MVMRVASHRGKRREEGRRKRGRGGRKEWECTGEEEQEARGGFSGRKGERREREKGNVKRAEKE